MKQNEPCCGNCCWFQDEDRNGWGTCLKASEFNMANGLTHRSGICKKEYISVKEMRHYIAVLILHQRWRRSDKPTGFYQMQNPIEIGKALDFVINYTKTFMEL